MLRWLVVLAVCALPRAAAAKTLEGHWTGVLDHGGVTLEVSFDFAIASSGTASGRFSSLTQRAMDYPLDEVTVDGATIHFVLDGDTVLDGTLASDALTGTFHDHDGAGTFALHRTALAGLPYDVREVTFGDGVSLAGTLAIPRSPGRHPAVVLLQGSGPETRWGTNRFIADRLARAGIVALIYDKRGSGASAGDWKTADYDDLARDALAGVTLLAHRKDVDAARIGLHGHSQGGIVAAAAAKRAPAAIAFIVAEDTVAGPVWKQDLYRTEHALADTFTPADAKAALELYELFIEVARGKRTYEALEQASRPVASTPWFAWLAIPPRDSWIWAWYAKTGTIDTLDLWSEVRVPTLLIYGERDRLVPVDDSIAQLEHALAIHAAPVTAWIAPAAEHNLTIHPAAGEPFFWWHAAPGVIDTVAAWIRQQADSHR